MTRAAQQERCCDGWLTSAQALWRAVSAHELVKSGQKLGMVVLDL